MKKPEYAKFKIKDIFDVEVPKTYQYRIVKDQSTNNGVSDIVTTSEISKGGCITFSLLANGNVFYQNDCFMVADESIIILRDKRYPVMHECDENIALYYVTVLKKCCEGRYCGEQYDLQTIANWEIQLPVINIAAPAKKVGKKWVSTTKPIVSYSYMLEYIDKLKKKIDINSLVKK